MIDPKLSIKRMKEYVGGKSIEEVACSYSIDERDIIKLGSNENCLGPSPAAIDAVKRMAGEVHLYPSVDAIELREELSKHYGFPASNIVVGAGMDGVIETMLRVYLDRGDESIIPLPTFSYYENVTNFNSATPVFVSRKPDYSLDVDAIIAKAGKHTKFVFITSPNNPTGNASTADEIRAISESIKGIVFLDEAYSDFSSGSLLDMAKKHDNVVIGRTMSKAWGLAGLRIGFGFVPDWIFKEYMKAATPFSLNRISIAAGIAALRDKAYYDRSIATVKASREYLMKNLPFKAFPSEANFILIDVSPLKARYVTGECMKRGIILRDCTSFRDMGDTFIRITVGTPEQNERVVDALRAIRGSP